MSMPINVYIGWDPRETDAYEIAEHSLKRLASIPVRVTPLVLDELSILTRPVERRGNQLWCPISEAPMSTEFAISRFCVPFLQTNGWAVFTDCDVLWLADVAELLEYADDSYALMVVKHNQRITSQTKMDGQRQVGYARKNWSSVVLWNCAHPSNRKLTLDALNTWPGRDLHAFKWLADEEIGELDASWNHLVTIEDCYVETPKLAHFTLGVPSMINYPVQHELADKWIDELELVLSIKR